VAVLCSGKVKKLKQPIDNLSLTVFSTGKIATGSWGVFEGPSKPIIMAQPAFLVSHPKGKMLFETGIHPEVSKNPVGYVGPFLYYGGFLKMEQEKGQDIGSQLKKQDIKLKDIKYE